MIRHAVLTLMALIVGSSVARAQANTAELLDQAARYHADLDVERELAILRRVISPNSPFVVTHEQRVLAYKYLGAALVVQGQPDSGILYFRAAIERDPFVDLEPQKFTPAELATFGQARRLTFGLGARPVVPDTLDPRIEHVPFAVLSTHAATLRVEIRQAGAPAGGVQLYGGDNDGLRELQWDGLLADGRLAPSGRYELLVAGISRLNQRADSIRLYFSLEQQYAPLEDTLSTLRPEQLLPEQQPPGLARRELLKGFGVAAAAVLIPRMLANGDLGGGGRTLAAGVAGAAAVAGIAGFVHRQRHREIPANVSANERRRAERAATNEGIGQRNRERLAEARLVIAPAAGVGP